MCGKLLSVLYLAFVFLFLSFSLSSQESMNNNEKIMNNSEPIVTVPLQIWQAIKQESLKALDLANKQANTIKELTNQLQISLDSSKKLKVDLVSMDQAAQKLNEDFKKKELEVEIYKNSLYIAGGIALIAIGYSVYRTLNK